jgi:hypothetical protein
MKKGRGSLLFVAMLGAITASAAAKAFPALSPDSGPASIWDVLVLGIPVGVLAASLAGSSARSLREDAQPDRTLPRRALWTVIDGFIGGWVAMFLLTFSFTRAYFEGVTPAVLGAFGGLLTEYIRTNGPRWGEQLWQTALTWISRKRAGDTPQ